MFRNYLLLLFVSVEGDVFSQILPWDSSALFHHHLEASNHLTSKSKFREGLVPDDATCPQLGLRYFESHLERNNPLSKYLNLAYCMHIPDISLYHKNSYLYISNLHIRI